MHREYCYKKKLKIAYKIISDCRRTGGGRMTEIEELILSNFIYRTDRPIV